MISKLNTRELPRNGSAHRSPLTADISSTEGIDLPRAEFAVRELLLAIGEDPDREGLLETPHRVAKSMIEFYGGLQEDPRDHLGKVFNEGSDEPVIVRNIEVRSHCEHHLLPIVGVAHVAYQPKDGKVVGLSKLARLVEGYCRRPQVQERLTKQIADALNEALDPEGVMVIVEAEHFCMKIRGIKDPCADTVTTATRGIFKNDAEARRHLVSLIYRKA